MENINLNNARQAKKNDEFYTSLSEVEQEMNAYLSRNPELFKDKTVLLPCDDPTWSSFTKYFIDNFHTLGLKKLISTCFAANEQSSAHESQNSLFDSVLHKKKTDFNHGKDFSCRKIFCKQCRQCGQYAYRKQCRQSA